MNVYLSTYVITWNSLPLTHHLLYWFPFQICKVVSLYTLFLISLDTSEINKIVFWNEISAMASVCLEEETCSVGAIGCQWHCLFYWKKNMVLIKHNIYKGQVHVCSFHSQIFYIIHGSSLTLMYASFLKLNIFIPYSHLFKLNVHVYNPNGSTWELIRLSD